MVQVECSELKPQYWKKKTKTAMENKHRLPTSEMKQETTVHTPIPPQTPKLNATVACRHKTHNLDEVCLFFENHKLPQVIYCEIDHSNSCMYTKYSSYFQMCL
jgi:hypothetical protein